MFAYFAKTEHVPCTVTVSHRFEELSAHVRFNDGSIIHPGDSVLVHGAEILAPFGTVVCEDRMATITRATFVERLWARATGDLEVMELYEFSFSQEAMI
jgi:hypothetical protein